MSLVLRGSIAALATLALVAGPVIAPPSLPGLGQTYAQGFSGGGGPGGAGAGGGAPGGGAGNAGNAGSPGGGNGSAGSSASGGANGVGAAVSAAATDPSTRGVEKAAAVTAAAGADEQATTTLGEVLGRLFERDERDADENQE